VSPHDVAVDSVEAGSGFEVVGASKWVHTTDHPKKDDASCPNGRFLITLLIGNVAAEEFWGIVTVIRHIIGVPFFVFQRGKRPAHEETGFMRGCPIGASLAYSNR
jgi:hypothetical protein